MSKRIKYFFGVVLLFFATVVLAKATSPETLPVKDNQQLAVTLSRVDMNRIEVLGDQIRELTYPTGFCTDKQGDDGASFLNVNVNEPFTLYIATESGHHFSLLVNPKAIVGKTLMFQNDSPSQKALLWERSENYQNLLVDVMRSMMLKQTPSGYIRRWFERNKSYAIFKNVFVTPIVFYQGAHLIGRVYRLQNQSKKSLTLSPRDFYAPGVRAVALSQQTLKPLGLGTLYEITSRQGAR